MHTEEINHNHSITKTYLRFTLPAIAAMLVNGLYQLVDGIFVGQYIGADGLAAINIAWPVTTLVAGFGLMLGMGAGSLISIARGENQIDKARSAMITGLCLCVCFGLISTAYLYFFDDFLVSAQNASGQVRQYALEYISAFIWGAPFTVTAGALPFLIRNDESPILATWLMIIGAIINIILDYIFIGLWGWGLYGAAVATIIAQISIVCLGVLYLLSPYSLLKVFHFSIHLSWIKAQKSIIGGSSSLVMFLYYGILIAIHNRLFTEYGSPVTVAAFAIVGYLMTLFYVVAEGIGEGLQPQVSYYHGAKKYHHIFKVARLATIVSFSVGMIWLAILNLFPNEVIYFFNGNDNPKLLQEATTGIRLHLAAMSLDGLILLASMYFLSVGRGRTSLCISVANMFIQFPFLAILPLFWGITGIWLSMPISNVLLASIVVPLMWRDILKQRQMDTKNMLLEENVIPSH